MRSYGGSSLDNFWERSQEAMREFEAEFLGGEKYDPHVPLPAREVNDAERKVATEYRQCASGLWIAVLEARARAHGAGAAYEKRWMQLKDAWLWNRAHHRWVLARHELVDALAAYDAAKEKANEAWQRAVRDVLAAMRPASKPWYSYPTWEHYSVGSINLEHVLVSCFPGETFPRPTGQSDPQALRDLRNHARESWPHRVALTALTRGGDASAEIPKPCTGCATGAH